MDNCPISSNSRKGALLAMVKGTKAGTVIGALKKMPEQEREQVEEVTLDMANPMNLIVGRSFSKATKVIDRFHVQKLAYGALQEMRIAHRPPLGCYKRRN